jgi:LPPG:FO 2-phospho-L-lactate transferase
VIVLLSGGTGGAKLARGMLDALGPSRLAVVANTGDDIAAFGLHVSPDPDLITYWLAGEVDEERGWGIEGETFGVFDRLVQLGGAEWFRLGDRDLATCMLRTEMLHGGIRLTEIAQALGHAHGVETDVLPMCDEPVQTYVRTEGEWRHFRSI